MLFFAFWLIARSWGSSLSHQTFPRQALPKASKLGQGRHSAIAENLALQLKDRRLFLSRAGNPGCNDRQVSAFADENHLELNKHRDQHGRSSVSGSDEGANAYIGHVKGRFVLRWQGCNDMGTHTTVTDKRLDYVHEPEVARHKQAEKGVVQSRLGHGSFGEPIAMNAVWDLAGVVGIRAVDAAACCLERLGVDGDELLRVFEEVLE